MWSWKGRVVGERSDLVREGSMRVCVSGRVGVGGWCVEEWR